MFFRYPGFCVSVLQTGTLNNQMTPSKKKGNITRFICLCLFSPSTAYVAIDSVKLHSVHPISPTTKLGVFGFFLGGGGIYWNHFVCLPINEIYCGRLQSAPDVYRVVSQAFLNDFHHTWWLNWQSVQLECMRSHFNNYHIVQRENWWSSTL